MRSFADIDRQLADIPPRVADLLAAIEAAHSRAPAARAQEPERTDQLAAERGAEMAAALEAAGGGPLSVRSLLQAHRILLGQDATPVPVNAHAGLMLTELIARYELAVSQRRQPRLLLLCALSLDFLAIRSFEEGGDRAADLLVVRELSRHGHDVARHASFAHALREGEHRAEALRASQRAWASSEHELWPWAAYVLDLVAAAYAAAG